MERIRIKITKKEVIEFGKMDDRITDRINQLQDYCHGKECKKEHWDCPVQCGCNDHLDLDTAIAWELADKIINEIPQCGENPDLSREEEYEEMRSLKYEIITFLGVLGHHRDKYLKLHDLIAVTVRDLEIYQNKIDICISKRERRAKK